MLARAKASPLAWFLVKALVGLLLLTGLWSMVSRWTSFPVGVLTGVTLEVAAGDWVQSAHTKPGTIEVQTRLAVRTQGRDAEVVVEADPAHFGYGLPIFLALLWTAGSWRGALKGLAARSLLGYVILMPGQVFSLSMELLRQMVIAIPGGARALGIAQWQLEGIALGYQLGSLVVPSLIPILLWVWLDRDKVQALTAASFRT